MQKNNQFGATFDTEGDLDGRGIEPTIEETDTTKLVSRPDVPVWKITLSLVLLFLNYFLAQYDKFILSYFQKDVVASLSLSSSAYGILSGYATGIVYALLALPAAYVADYTDARVWVLTVSALWWSLCAIFQGLSHTFWQILLARIGMGIGQAPVEALSVSLISDLMGKEYVFFGERYELLIKKRLTPLMTNIYSSVLYVGVYIGEAVSGQIAVAFARTKTPWNTALIAIGIVGIVVAIFIRVLIREPWRQTSLISLDAFNSLGEHSGSVSGTKISYAYQDAKSTFSYLFRMRSFWLLALSASFRQLSGNVFGYYMPTYLSDLYPSHPDILSKYGIIVGVVGSFAVLLGGLITSAFWDRTKTLPLYLVGVGGMLSSIFVLLMLFSRSVKGSASEDSGIKVLYGTMSVAYLTAELWLGAINSLIVLLLPPRYKTFGLSIWAATQVLIYSAGPEIIGLALRNTDSSSQAYIDGTRIALAIIIPVGYWLAGVGFLLSIPLVRRDLAGAIVQGKLGMNRKIGFVTFGIIVAVMVIILFVVSIVYKA
jgi:MFS family permease